VSADFGVSRVTLAGRAAGSGRKLQRIVVERIIRGLLPHRRPLNISFEVLRTEVDLRLRALDQPDARYGALVPSYSPGTLLGREVASH
jgi:hypothetical protein